MDILAKKQTFLLVDAQVLPDIFLRVVESKKMLACGKAKSLSEAAERMGISRSTLYKYKDHVFPYEMAMERQIATITVELEDRKGVLSSLLGALSENGANILTINQNIPVDGVAPVSISLRTDNLADAPGALVQCLSALDGVVNIRLLSN